jgi:hypothetical protein
MIMNTWQDEQKYQESLRFIEKNCPGTLAAIDREADRWHRWEDTKRVIIGLVRVGTVLCTFACTLGLVMRFFW